MESLFKHPSSVAEFLLWFKVFSIQFIFIYRMFNLGKVNIRYWWVSDDFLFHRSPCFMLRRQSFQIFYSTHPMDCTLAFLSKTVSFKVGTFGMRDSKAKHCRAVWWNLALRHFLRFLPSYILIGSLKWEASMRRSSKYVWTSWIMSAFIESVFDEKNGEKQHRHSVKHFSKFRGGEITQWVRMQFLS